VFLYTVASIPLWASGAILAWTFPARRLFSSPGEVWAAAAGVACYAVLHLFVHRPERLYLWGHEISHLAAAKLFLRRVHGFHITSRAGGRVVIDRTNVAIDLAPYVVPFYAAVAAAAALLLRHASPWVPRLYPAAGAFLLAMHVAFSARAFWSGQPDLARSGRLFSAAVVFAALLLWLPSLAAPGTAGGWKAAAGLYRDWLGAFWREAERLLAAAGRRL